MEKSIPSDKVKSFINESTLKRWLKQSSSSMKQQRFQDINLPLQLIRHKSNTKGQISPKPPKQEKESSKILQQILAKEDEIFNWLQQSPECVQQYITSPLEALKKHNLITSSEEKELINLTRDYSYGVDEVLGKEIDHFTLFQCLHLLSQNSATNLDSSSNTKVYQDWHYELYEGGSEEVFIIANEGYIYAGCNGYITKLDSYTGKKEATNNLSGLGQHKIGLALSADGKILYAALNSYITALNTKDLTYVWPEQKVEIKDTGDDLINLLIVGDNIYAGGNGYVYQVACLDGTIVAHNDLPHRGNHEVQLAVSNDNSQLYVGTDGYAIGINLNDFSHNQWESSLKNSGDNKVFLLVNDTTLYAASNGYLYTVNQSNDETPSIDLNNRGKHEVQLCINNEENLLYATTDHYVIAFDLDDLNGEPKWQTNLPDASDNFISILMENNSLYVGSNGYIYNLNPLSGVITFTQKLNYGGSNVIMTATTSPAVQLIIGTGGYVISQPTAGNPSAGWDIVTTLQTSNVNSALQALLYQEVIPTETKNEFTTPSGIIGTSSLKLGAPLLISGNYAQITVSLPLDGELKLKKYPLPIKINANATFTVNLQNIFVSLNKDSNQDSEASEKPYSYKLLLDFKAEEVFSNLELSINLLNHIYSMEEVNEVIQHLLYEATKSKSISVHSFNSDLNLPFSTITGGLTYTPLQNSSENGFIGILLGNSLGNFYLPQIISQPKTASSEIVLSNRTILGTIEQVLKLIPDLSSFELDNEYPSTLSNKNTIPLGSKADMHAHIDEGDLSFFINDKQQLEIEIKAKIYGWATLGIHQPVHINIFVDFSTNSDGEICLSFTSSSKIPWYVLLLNPLILLGPFEMLLAGLLGPTLAGPFLDKLLKNLIDNKGDLPIPIPNFFATDITSPSYIQISGNWESEKNIKKNH